MRKVMLINWLAGRKLNDETNAKIAHTAIAAARGGPGSPPLCV